MRATITTEGGNVIRIVKDRVVWSQASAWKAAYQEALDYARRGYGPADGNPWVYAARRMAERLRGTIEITLDPHKPLKPGQQQPVY